MIETERLCLRKMIWEDVDGFLEIFTDPRVMESFGGNLFDRKQMEAWVGRNLSHQAEYGYGLFSVILKSEDRLIGDCGLEKMEVAGAPEVELGYDFNSNYWNRGYATESAIAVREYAWHTLGLTRLISLVRPSNVASCRVARKVGMTREREITLSGHIYLVYAVKRPEP
jgi:ribosomal-protein-alanine N-acetyltransferase